MAENTTTESVILDFQIKQGDALNELSKTKKAIIDLKDEQKQLNDAYKKGEISVEAYAKETVQLEAALKKQTAAYSNVQRQVTGLKSPFDQLNESIKDQAKQVTVAGVSLSTFANPATATIAVLGGLFTAYKSSTTGAKDLEFASNQLSAATGLLTEKFAQLFSSAEDGEGFFSTQISGFLDNVDKLFGSDIGKKSREISLNAEKLQDLNRDEISIRSDISDRLADNQEKLTEIGQEQTSNNKKLQLYDEIITNLKTNQDEIVGVKQKELDILKQISEADPNNEDKLEAVLNAEKDLNRERTKAEKLIQANVRAQDNLKDSIFSGNKAVEAGIAGLEQTVEFQKMTLDPSVDDEIIAQAEAYLELEIAQEQLSESENALTEDQKKQIAVITAKHKAVDGLTQAQRDQLQAMEAISQALGNASVLFAKDSAAYKVIASARAVIDTYRGVTASLALGGPLGIIEAGITLATGLAAVAKINEVGFSEGGFTGYGGKYQPAGVVHKGEVVWSQADVALAGGAARVNAMRPTYSDGGIVADGMARQAAINGGSQVGATKVIFEEIAYNRFKQGLEFKEMLTTV